MDEEQDILAMEDQTSEQEETVLELYGISLKKAGFGDIARMFKNDSLAEKDPSPYGLIHRVGCIAASQTHTVLMDYPDE